MKKIITSIRTNIKNESLVKKRHHQIFEAAIKLFSQKGYHQTTLRELSKESGITLGNLYDYISTKEDILYIIQKEAFLAIRKAVSNEENEGLDPVEKLKRLITSELEAMNRYEELILIIYQESHAMSKKLLRELLSSERIHVEQYENLIKEGIKKGVFRRANVRMTANMIKMLIDTWVIKRWDLRGKVALKEMSQGIVDMVFKGIIVS